MPRNGIAITLLFLRGFKVKYLFVGGSKHGQTIEVSDKHCLTIDFPVLDKNINSWYPEYKREIYQLRQFGFNNTTTRVFMFEKVDISNKPTVATNLLWDAMVVALGVNTIKRAPVI